MSSYYCKYALLTWEYSLWVRTPLKARCTRYNIDGDKVCQWLATSWWFPPGTPVSSANKTDRHNITEILLKVALNTIKQTIKQTRILITKTSLQIKTIHLVLTASSIKEYRLVDRETEVCLSRSTLECVWVDQHVYVWTIVAVS